MMTAGWRRPCPTSAVVVFGADAAPAADFRSADAQMGCKVWNDRAPREDEVVTRSDASRGSKAVGASPAEQRRNLARQRMDRQRRPVRRRRR